MEPMVVPVALRTYSTLRYFYSPPARGPYIPGLRCTVLTPELFYFGKYRNIRRLLDALEFILAGSFAFLWNVQLSDKMLHV